ncbi:nucleic acid-binding protein [Cylindrobasidium torrendii FP15055 ss-10]|uniref:Nucleic acid-binding protein n=1 Tax=Cylindrobasidium torrendii FP15055 ss-10 TaxID=1314674 RepID=A0A0D7BRC6_9AGAR|nr:nucleic acid-binding protein [Cylindrobasidium torrendii FP15055 ss-10]
MFSALRSAAAPRAALRTFSTSASRADMARLTLIGNLGADPETRNTKNDRQFVTYTVATQSVPPVDAETGERGTPKTTWHRVFSFNEHANRYLMNLKKGSKVYVEAAFEMREPEPGSEPSTPQGQRQILLRHENIKVVGQPKHSSDDHI